MTVISLPRLIFFAFSSTATAPAVKNVRQARMRAVIK